MNAGFAREDERKRIRWMLDEVRNILLATDNLDHNVLSESPATHVILDVLRIVSDGLSTGISVSMFKHLYPSNPED